MKKILYSAFALLFSASVVDAKTVSPSVAQAVAVNYISAKAKMKSMNLTLAYTEKSVSGEADYYVFNINNGSGFIIISAEDAGHPVIGYSTTEGHYAQPSSTSNPNFNFWMEKRKAEIEFMRNNNVQADAEIANEWSNYSANKILPTVTSSTFICQTTWDQSGGGSVQYNNLCPGGSVTGCVATAMAQIMKKWNYPTTGTSSSSYCDCTANGYSQQYGTLSFNYGTTTFQWSSMPNASSNAAVATLMYACGVSVNMNYDPSGSGAVVCGGNPSAQYSYPTYFKYNPNTIQCLNQTSYTAAAWRTLLDAEFTANPSRPVQYQGVDASAGGHTWVADGDDGNGNIHMNWGWSGSCDAFYAPTNLAPNGSGLDFTTQLGGLFGIEPAITTGLDCGIASVTSPTGTSCASSFTPKVTLQDFGTVTLTSCKITPAIDGVAGTPYTWNGSLTTGNSAVVTMNPMTATAGTHTFTATTSAPNSSTDINTSNDVSQSVFTISSTSTLSLPLQQGFESLSSLPSGWTASHTPAGGDPVDWVVVSNVGHNSSYSMGANNCDSNSTNTSNGNTGYKYDVTLPPYDFTNATSTAGMTFDVGYLPAQSGSVYTDSLAVYYSKDCGVTWTKAYYKGGVTLATGPTYSVTTTVNCMAPSNTQWRNETIQLGTLAGQSSVLFKFEDISDWGSWIYVDNINILTTAVGVEAYNTPNGFNIYPNPASTLVTIEGVANAENINYTIINMLGAEVKTGNIPASGNNFSGKIQVSDMSHGMYFLRVNDGKNIFTKKLNVQ